MRTHRFASQLAVMLLVALPTLGGEHVSRSMDVAPGATIEIENFAGSIEVEGWARSSIEIEADLGDDVRGLEVSERGGSVSIQVEIPDRSSWGRRDLASDLRIRVPEGARLEIESVSAEIVVRGARGIVAAESVSGSVDVAGAPVQVDLATVSGTITLAGSATRAEVESVSGSVILRGIGGLVEAQTVSGELTVEAEDLERADFETVSGDLELSATLAPGARVYAESHSGSLTLLLPSDTRASFEVSTFSGNIRNEFGGEARRTSGYGPGKELDFSTGDDARIRAETFSGNVRLGRR